MIVKYRNDKIKRQCTELKKAKKDFGEYAESVLDRINLIKGMVSFKDLLLYPPARCHILNGDYKNYWAVDVKGRKCSLRIILAPLDENDEIILSDSEFTNKCVSLNIVLIEEISDHYE